MVPTGVRLACPDCTLSCVMKHEGDMPEGITRVVEGVPWCPNCQQPMKPVASVDVTPKPAVQGPDGLSANERLAKIRDYAREVELAEKAWDRKKADAKEAKEHYDHQVTTLRTAIERLTGEPATLPLFDQIPAAEGGAMPADVQAAHQALDAAVADRIEDVRLRLAELGVCVEPEDIRAWAPEAYDAVVAWCEPAANRATFPPALEPHQFIPGWAQSLKEKLDRLEVAINLSGRDGVFALTVPQREEALAWVTRELEEPGALPRPSCLPAPQEAAPTPRRRGKKTGPQGIVPPPATDVAPADATAPAP